MTDDAARFRRPASLPQQPPASPAPDSSPGRRAELAEDIARALLTVGRDDPALALRRADDLGVVELTEAWSGSESGSLPDVLLTLHVLRTWLHFRSTEARLLYETGRHAEQVSEVVAGLPDTPTTDDLAGFGETLLLLAYGGRLAAAADRAAAFLGIVAAGREQLADPASDEAPALVGQAAKARAGAAVLRRAATSFAGPEHR
jgi:hypothetical protein